jgi:hypothetical protein
MLFDLRPLDLPPETAPFRFTGDTCRHPTAQDGVLSADLTCDSHGYWRWGATHHVAWPLTAEDVTWQEASAEGIEPEHADALAALPDEEQARVRRLVQRAEGSDGY